MREKKEEKFLMTAAVMAVIILLAKLLGLFRDILVAQTYGTTPPAIAYETASRLPTLVFDVVIGGVVSAAFIPVFSDLLVREGKKSAMQYASAYVNLVLLFSGILTAIGMIFAAPLVELLAPALSEGTKELAVSMTRILFPMVICTGLAYSFVGILQSMGEFRIPALISLASNLLMVAYILLFGDRFGITGLSVAMLCGWAVQVLIQLPKLHEVGFRFSLRAGIFSSHILGSVRLAVPILIGTWTQPLCSVINTRFTSSMEDGRAITAFGYANRLYTIIVGVFSFVATNLLFPYFSRAAASGDRDRSRRMMLTSVKTLFYIIAPIAVGLAVLAEPLAAILYERGEFTPSDTALTAAALRCFSVGMLFMAGNEVLTKAFFADKEPKIPMFTSIAAMCANFALVAWLSVFGIGGVALASGLATAIQFVFNATAMMLRARKAWPLADFADLVKSAAAALLMGGVLVLLLPVLPNGYILQTVCAVGIGAAVYAAATVLLRSEEAKYILAVLRRKTKGEDAE